MVALSAGTTVLPAVMIALPAGTTVLPAVMIALTAAVRPGSSMVAGPVMPVLALTVARLPLVIPLPVLIPRRSRTISGTGRVLLTPGIARLALELARITAGRIALLCARLDTLLLRLLALAGTAGTAAPTLGRSHRYRSCDQYCRQ